jgi:hypothetical protein
MLTLFPVPAKRQRAPKPQPAPVPLVEAPLYGPVQRIPLSDSVETWETLDQLADRQRSEGRVSRPLARLWARRWLQAVEDGREALRTTPAPSRRATAGLTHAESDLAHRLGLWLRRGGTDGAEASAMAREVVVELRERVAAVVAAAAMGGVA